MNECVSSELIINISFSQFNDMMSFIIMLYRAFLLFCTEIRFL
jgi:hypothetical protein